MASRVTSPHAHGVPDDRTPESAEPLPLAEAIARGRTTELQRAALEHAARENRRSLAAELRAALHPPTR
jgi:hypothetical protein